MKECCSSTVSASGRCCMPMSFFIWSGTTGVASSSWSARAFPASSPGVVARRPSRGQTRWRPVSLASKRYSIFGCCMPQATRSAACSFVPPGSIVPTFLAASPSWSHRFFSSGVRTVGHRYSRGSTAKTWSSGFGEAGFGRCSPACCSPSPGISTSSTRPTAMMRMRPRRPMRPRRQRRPRRPKAMTRMRARRPRRPRWPRAMTRMRTRHCGSSNMFIGKSARTKIRL
mmetsp:Transcript_110092/g.350704  ORF Transcript_110092/g.350704 Transcript_110092/m.350704 type:complete len:228 (-) Transcript_110092:501-1184(-)